MWWQGKLGLRSVSEGKEITHQMLKMLLAKQMKAGE
jgi:hypothetical protein